MSLPPIVDTPRLRLRRPTRADAVAVFTRYASDAEVTRYRGWPRHVAVGGTAFIEASERQWSASGEGPYLAFDRDARLVGSTGIELETPWRAVAGYVLARDVWGPGSCDRARAR
jgi:RimJ/RimL family protein N-acetyltransferase